MTQDADLRRWDSGTERIKVEIDAAERIGWIVFDNLAKHNALSLDMYRAIPRVIDHLNDADDVRVVVMTGAGDKAFISGGDIGDAQPQLSEEQRQSEQTEASSEATRAWGRLEKPLIAMISGYCLGGGLATALQADIRIAREGSSFGIPAALLGLDYSMKGIALLVDVAGAAWASDIMFSARRLTAEEALSCGLVNKVVAPGDLRDATLALARTIAGNAPLTIRAAKAAIREVRRDPAERDHDRVAALVEACLRSEDRKEGLRAFAEKRPPRFTGR